MLYKQIEGTDLTVSRIALGCMRIADMQVDALETLVDKALSLGINFFDHADIMAVEKVKNFLEKF